MKKLFHFSLTVLVLVIGAFVFRSNVLAASCGSFYTPNASNSCDCVHEDDSSQLGTKCCGWIQKKGAAQETCAGTTTVTCGTGVPTGSQYNSILCPSSCSGNTNYTENGVQKRCCGYAYNNSCHPSQARVVSCGSGYATDDFGATCNSSCPANGSYTDPADKTIKYCCGHVFDGTCSAIYKIATCGNVYQTSVQCPVACPASTMSPLGGGTYTCCGWAPPQGGCQATQPTVPPTTRPTVPPTTQPGGGGNGNTDATGLTNATFDTFNSAIFGNGGPDAALKTPRGIISKLLPYLFTFGGLILFLMILWGGFEMLTGAADPKMQEAGKNRITAAVVGFLLLFASYWLAQIVQAIFGISIL